MRRTLRRFVALAVTLTVAMNLAAQSSPAPQLARRGADALAAGDYYEAIETYQEALSANPNYLDALVGLAEAYYWLGEYDQAQKFVDRASRLARSRPDVINLAGRIAIGRGDLEAAEDAFARVQEAEPNNVGAAIGQAELALARGQSADAARRLERTLRLNPDQRKALLSLVLVYEYMGEPEVAQRYLDIARSVHRDSPEVHILAAQYYLRAGDYDQASQAARTAQAIDPFSRAAVAIRAEIALLQKSYLEAATLAEELISTDRSAAEAWYVRAVARHRLGEVDTALASIRTALRMEAENEILRIWAEWLALQELDLDDPVRTELAEERAVEARRLKDSFRYERAFRAYQRALQLAPLELDLRREYARLFRDMGHNASYLQELELLRADGLEDPSLLSTIDVFRNTLSSSVAARWGVDQFTIDRSRTPFGLYLLRDPRVAGYPESETALLSFVRRTLQSVEQLEIVDAALVGGYADAFSSARSEHVDFFAQIEFGMTSRLSAIDADLYVGRTGSLATSQSTVRTGPGHAAAAVHSFADELVAQLPVRGRIIRRDNRRVVIDLGARDGLQVDQEFLVVEADSITIAPDATELVYPEESIIGSLTVTAVDDLIAEARLRPSGIVDLVTVGDAVVATIEDEEEDERTPPRDDLFPILYERVRRLR